jgi:hypothetical protein
MARNHRIFSSFAIEDAVLRSFLVGQARNERSPFSFVDMSVKEPWDSDWKANCRTKIKGCDGVIGIVTRRCCTNRIADGMAPAPGGPMPRQQLARFEDGRFG